MSEVPEVITLKEIQRFFNIGERGAQKRLRSVRLALGKNTGKQHSKGGDPVTRQEFYAHFNHKI